MSKKYIDTKKKPLFFKFIRGILTKFYKRSEFVGTENLPNEAFVVVANHSQLYSPLTFELYSPIKKRIWCTSEMMSAREFPGYAKKLFWPNKPKRVAWLYSILGVVVAPLIAYLFKRADAIPVYRDRRIVKTMELSVEGLMQGENAVIFAECDDFKNNVVNKLNRGFVDVARLYYAKTKKSLLFVPTYNAVKLSKVIFGEPIAYDPTARPTEERERITTYIEDEITRLAQELPAHQVVPFLVPQDGKLPMSK